MLLVAPGAGCWLLIRFHDAHAASVTTRKAVRIKVCMIDSTGECKTPAALAPIHVAWRRLVPETSRLQEKGRLRPRRGGATCTLVQEVVQWDACLRHGPHSRRLLLRILSFWHTVTQEHFLVTLIRSSECAFTRQGQMLEQLGSIGPREARRRIHYIHRKDQQGEQGCCSPERPPRQPYMRAFAAAAGGGHNVLLRGFDLDDGIGAAGLFSLEADLVACLD